MCTHIFHVDRWYEQKSAKPNELQHSRTEHNKKAQKNRIYIRRWHYKLLFTFRCIQFECELVGCDKNIFIVFFFFGIQFCLRIRFFRVLCFFQLQLLLYIIFPMFLSTRTSLDHVVLVTSSWLLGLEAS